MNERISRLITKLFEQEPKVCSERCNIFTESIKQNALKPIAIRRANAFYDVLDKMTIWVKDDELIVGNQAKWPKAAPVFPEYSNKWILEEMEGKPYKWDERPGDKFYADEDVKEDLKECIKYWEDKALIDALRESLPEDILCAWDAIEVVAEQSANWEVDQGYAAAQNIITANPDVELFYCGNDGMAIGAVRAITEAKLEDQIKVIGFDGISEALNMISDGSLYGSVAQFPGEMGILGVQNAVDVLNGETIEQYINTGAKLITPENVEEHKTYIKKFE